MAEERPIRVAIVGTGLAGLTTGYLLAEDLKSRYACTIFESGDRLSLDAASRTVTNPTTGNEERIDLPMRAMAGGYYQNLRRMYDHLGVPYHAQSFLFRFSTVNTEIDQAYDNGRESSYFVHASNHHQFPPVLPNGVSWVWHMLQVIYLLLCYVWFSLCCMVVTPRTRNGEGETFSSYLERIRLPTSFIRFYVLPLFCSVATCSHQELLGFPAADLISYKSLSHGAEHYVTKDGIRSVQNKLTASSFAIRLLSKVIAVEPASQGVIVRWTSPPKGSGIFEQHFDRAVLAVSPDVVQQIYGPVRPQMAQIPRLQVTSVLHSSSSSSSNRNASAASRRVSSETVSRSGSSTNRANARATAHVIRLNTSAEGEYRTESNHVQLSGTTVTTCPLRDIDPTSIIQTSKFTRVLRTPRSRRILNHVFREHEGSTVYQSLEKQTWRNGDDNVWLVGGWCWDGMVLLEGCVVSAMRVADDFGVEIPWRSRGNTMRHNAYQMSVLRIISVSFVLIAAVLSARSGVWRILLKLGRSVSFLLGLLCSPVVRWLLRRSLTEDGNESSIYKLDHGVLNVDPTPRTMWMNMGFWRDTREFPRACEALLSEVLSTAGLRQSMPQLGQARSIIDLGFGCGDQTEKMLMLSDRYVGITKDKVQHEYAQQRLGDQDASKIFCADAARPASWSVSLSNALRISSDLRYDTWVLALDCLYHFSPSRQPLFHHARHQLNASIAAFDLLLPDEASLTSRTLLSLLARLMSAPPSNFLTVKQYRQQLIDAGYEEGSIQIHDISENVFGPLAAFLGHQDRALRRIGLGIGPYRAAQWTFDWWARSGVVRGCIVVARR